MLHEVKGKTSGASIFVVISERTLIVFTLDTYLQAIVQY